METIKTLQTDPKFFTEDIKRLRAVLIAHNLSEVTLWRYRLPKGSCFMNTPVTEADLTVSRASATLAWESEWWTLPEAFTEDTRFISKTPGWV